MKIIPYMQKDVFLIEPHVFTDVRGYFYERFNASELAQEGIQFKVCQDNIAFTKKRGTLRGMGFQNEPYAQGKIISCLKGTIRDVCVDLRKGSPDYLKWYTVELSDANKRSLYIPRGFAHGYITESEDVLVQFMVDNPYMKEYERGFRYDDPTIGIDCWGTVNESLMTERDRRATSLSESGCNYKYMLLNYLC